MLLKEDYDNSIKESEMAEMMKQEEYQIQEQCAKCHKVGRKNSAKGSATSSDGFQEVHKAAQHWAKNVEAPLSLPIPP
jgi:hypothetical protein